MSLKEIIKKDYKNFIPCSEKGCSWETPHGKEVSNPVVLKNNGYYGAGYIRGEELYLNGQKFNSVIDEKWLKDISDTEKFYYFFPAS